jgi:hypothetical protein
MAVQPSAEHHVGRERARFAGEIGEHGLRHVLGQVRVTPSATQGYGVHKVYVSCDQFSKGGFRTPLDILPQKKLGIRHN